MIWFLVAVCWIISFLFSGIEAGLLALNPVRLRHRTKSGDRAAQRLHKMLKQPERLLITVLLVTNAADIIALIILTHELVIRWGWMGYPITVAIARRGAAFRLTRDGDKVADAATRHWQVYRAFHFRTRPKSASSLRRSGRTKDDNDSKRKERRVKLHRTSDNSQRRRLHYRKGT